MSNSNYSYYLSILLLLFGSCRLYAADDEYNILSNDSITNDSSRIISLLDISKKFEGISNTLSYNAAKRAKNISSSISSPALIAKSNYQEAKVLLADNKYDISVNRFKDALAFYENTHDKVTSAKLLSYIGEAYQGLDNYSKAAMFFNSSLATYSEIDDSINVGITYIKLGDLHYVEDKPDIAVANLNNAFVIANALQNSYLRNLCILKLSMMQMPGSDNDSIENKLQQVISYARINGHNKLISDAYLQLSRYYFLINKLSKAKEELAIYVDFNDSVKNVEYVNLENFLLNNSKVDKGEETSININFIYYVFLALLIVLVLFMIYKVGREKTMHGEKINLIKAELKAFDKINTNVSELTEQRIIERRESIFYEIEENEKTEKALTNSLSSLMQVNNLKDVFLSKISREIRTPLNGIMGFSEILETELALLEDDSLYEYANSISQSGQSLVLLLNNILDISRLDSDNFPLEIKTHKLNELIHSVVDSYSPESLLKGIKIIFSPENNHEITTDVRVFTKIISLIIDNSIKFTEKGFIKISHAFDEQLKTVSLIVKDTGIGIDKVYINQVFEPYRQESLGYTKSYQGAGLGLPLAKKMILKLSGDISIDSQKGIGTTVTITFPVEQNVSGIKADETSKNEVVDSVDYLPWEKLSVLVVEDDRMNQILYRKLLKKAKNIEVAKDGKTALAYVEQASEKIKFDLVLMDINLPDPWDGIKLMNEIRNRWSEYKKVPFIAQTAYAISGNREAMLDEGFDEYITKPILKSVLIDTINKVVS